MIHSRYQKYKNKQLNNTTVLKEEHLRIGYGCRYEQIDMGMIR